ncbi:hypothetical protein Bpfe_030527 [Biomphalaria pfeifferi]|uniref:Uncharacterized protein n=1 Tax=Biomphalaria pfeifferi TaxID=112525 RepID=A0AAD8APM1_BIOPF|nr:hypothetical protein Bpfe_030527 [Biomphalaria pfeifferi]
MAHHPTPWLTIPHHGSPSHTMANHPTPWLTIPRHGSPSCTMAHYPTPWLTIPHHFRRLIPITYAGEKR